MEQTEQASQSAATEIASRLRKVRARRTPPEHCPHFNGCSVNLCPYDPDIDKRTFDPDDAETECTVSKGDRERIYSQMPPEMQASLPYKGLYRAEFNRRESSRLRFSRLSEAERAKMLSNLTPGSRTATRRTTEAHA